MSNLSRTKWHWDWFFNEYLDFPLSVTSYAHTYLSVTDAM